MKAFFLFMASLVVFSAAGCQKSAVESGRLSLLSMDKKWSAAIAKGDIEQIVSFWADDAMAYVPGAPAAIGKDAIRAMVKRNRKTPGFALTTNPVDAVVSSSGDLGYTFGTFTLSIQNPEGKSESRNGNYVCIWKKQTDGAWNCVVDISNFRTALN